MIYLLEAALSGALWLALGAVVSKALPKGR